jgi:mono/diheme cytochrome c family protein
MVSFVEAPLGDKADPSRPFDARPEWYFFWLFELLHHFEPPIDWVGTLLIPGLVAAFFVLLPWLDRGRSRAPRDRRGPLLAAGAMGAALAVLTVNVAVRDALGAASEAAQPPESLVPAPGISAVQAGMIYGDRCTECHARDGSPVDPEARDFRSADFKRMARTDFAALVKVVEEGGDIMPAFAGELTPEEIRGVLTHVVLEFPEVDEDEVRRALAHAQAEFEKKEE